MAAPTAAAVVRRWHHARMTGRHRARARPFRALRRAVDAEIHTHNPPELGIRAVWEILRYGIGALVSRLDPFDAGGP